MRHTKDYLLITDPILLCYIVTRKRITVRLRLVRIVFKVGWPSHSCWLLTVSYTIC